MMRWNEKVWKRTQAVVLWALGAAGIVLLLLWGVGRPPLKKKG